MQSICWAPCPPRECSALQAARRMVLGEGLTVTNEAATAKPFLEGLNARVLASHPNGQLTRVHISE